MGSLSQGKNEIYVMHYSPKNIGTVRHLDLNNDSNKNAY